MSAMRFVFFTVSGESIELERCWSFTSGLCELLFLLACNTSDNLPPLRGLSIDDVLFSLGVSVDAERVNLGELLLYSAPTRVASVSAELS